MPKRPSPSAATWILLAVAGLACDFQPPRPVMKRANVAASTPEASTPKPEPNAEAKAEPKKDQPERKRPPIVPVGIAEAKKRAIGSAQGGNLEAAIKLLREGLQTSPDDREGNFLIAAMLKDEARGMSDAKARNAQFLESAKFGRKVLQAHKDQLFPVEQAQLTEIFYMEACALAMAGKPDDARKSLEQAASLGFEDFEALDQDKDLDSLRKQPGYAAFRKSLSDKADATIKARAQTELAAFKSFPFDFDLKTVGGKPLKLEDLKGQVAIVDLWGTWCPPCRKEIPHFKELYGKYKGKGLEIVGVNYEKDATPEESLKLIKEFLQKVPVPYPLVLGDEATQNRIPGFSSYPTTLFIDRAGKVRMMLEGYTPMPRLDALVRTLLDEKS